MDYPVKLRTRTSNRFISLVSIVLLVTLLVLLLLLLVFFVQQERSDQDDSRGMHRQLPHAIIIGARKCGTRALLEFLNLHPDVRAAAEEIHFFDKKMNYMKGLQWYQSRMPLSEPAQQITVEKSPAYFVTGGVPHRMHAMNSSVRVVLIVRDPVRRVVSDYTQIVQKRRYKGKPVPKLETLILTRDGRVNPAAKMVRTSTYAYHLKRWLQRFPSSQIHVVDGDNLVQQPLEEMRLVESFLGLRPSLHEHNFVYNATKGFYCAKSSTGVHCLGKEKGRKHPPVSPETIRKLSNYFTKHDDKFQQLTQRSYLWMKKL